MPEPILTDILIGFIFSPLGIMLLVVVAAVYMVLIFYKKFKGLVKEFEGVPLESVLKQKYNSILQVTALRGKWGNLRREEKVIAKVLKVGVIAYTAPNPLYKKKKRKKKSNPKEEEKEIAEIVEKKPAQHKYTDRKLYIFRLSFNLDWPLIRQLLDFFTAPNYAVVEEDNVTRFDIDKRNRIKTYFNISPDVPVFSFGNVFVYGYYPLQFTRDVAWIHGREKELEENVNYAKRVVFLDSQHTKKIETLGELEELESKKYRERLGRATG